MEMGGEIFKNNRGSLLFGAKEYVRANILSFWCALADIELVVPLYKRRVLKQIEIMR